MERRDRIFVTGAAGFIGSNLVDRLLADGYEVVGYDNLSTGFREFLEPASQHPAFTFVEGDLLDRDRLGAAVARAGFVYHLAANADVRLGTERPGRDLEQNTLATFNLLEAMRAGGVKRLAFSSTGSVYGEPSLFPTPESAPFPVQTSLYGASKLACEGLISAYCEGFGFQAWIFRFVSVLGERYTHGHVYDFFAKLKRDPTRLHVLGNGKQRKSYVYVQDCIDAMLIAVARAQDKVNILNLGTAGHVDVDESVRVICGHMGVQPAITYAGGERGWVGDSPLIFLDTSRIRTLGWQPRFTISDGLARTLDWLGANQWVYERRR
jgi:UDP-glucose 4-epimerase